MKNNRIIVLALAAVLAVLLVLALPLHFQKFELEHYASVDSRGAESIWFADVSGDGYDDLIACSRTNYSFLPEPSCVCMRLDEHMHTYVIDQINVPAMIDGPTLAASSNYNHNAYHEILIPTVEDGGLWLHVFEGPDLSVPIRRIYLDTLHTKEGKAHVSFFLQGQFDADGDGIDEVLITLVNGFPMYPRRNYLIDIEQGVAMASPATAAGMRMEMGPSRAGQQYFSGYSVLPGNDHGKGLLPYSDMFGYAFAFDPQLQFVFEPEPVAKYPGRVHSQVVGDRLYTYIFHNEAARRVEIQKRSLPDGQLIGQADIEALEGLFKVLGEGLLVSGQGKALIIDTSLQVVRRVEDPRLVMSTFHLDLTGDDIPELIHHDFISRQLTLFDHQFEHPVSVPFDQPRFKHLFAPHNRAGQAVLAGLGRDEVFFYTYTANPLYWLRWPYYLLVAALAWAISAFLFQLFRKNIETRYQQEQELARLHMLALKNQMDPHFTLNALNSIDQMYRGNEPDKASRFMEQLSRLIYATVRDSDLPLTNLQNELDFCRNYCALESFRDSAFTFEITVDEDVDLFEVTLPKQFVFIHVENAIKHGLRPIDRPKKLSIRVRRQGSRIHLEVSNNGVLYAPDGKKEDGSTGRGFILLEKMKGIYKKMEGRKIGYRIHAGEKVGTQVEIWVEVKPQ